MRLRPVVLALLLTAASSSAACRAREEPRGALGDTATVPTPAAAQPGDGSIVASLGHAAEMVISTARTAEPRVRSRDVREYVQRVLEEHTAMRQALDSVANSRNIARQAPLSRESADAALAQRADALLRAPDTAFDTTYVATQMMLDTEFLENVTRFSTAAADEQLRLLLRGWIPESQARITKGLGIYRSLTR